MKRRLSFIQRFSQSIQLRLTFYFLLILIPLVSVSLYSGYTSQSILKQQLVNETQSMLNSEMGNIDMIMQDVDELSMQISTEEHINEMLGGAGKELTTTNIFDFQKIMNEILNIRNVNHWVSDISILHVSSGMIISSRYGGRRIDHYEDTDWFQKTVKANGQGVIIIPSENVYNASGNLDPVFNTKTITLMRGMDLYKPSQDNRNIVTVTINKETLLPFSSKLSESEKTAAYLFSSDQRPIATTSKNENDLGRLSIQDLTRPDKKKLIVHVQSPYSNWSLYMIEPKDAIFSQTKQVERFTYLIIGMSFILALWISWAVYSNISSPLRKLANGMKQLKMGLLDTQITFRRRDEFGRLMESFNQMAKEQKILIRDIYQKKLLLAEANLNFLQSQINPHFLYNTLDAIYWMAKNCEVEETCEMVLNLSKFFRLSLAKGRETFTVSETIEHLNFYIRVQQIRYDDRFTVHYQISDECRNVRILKLLLQPLVENAIVHGLGKKYDSGELVISVFCEEEILKIEIIDNGVGIEQERLTKMHDELAVSHDVTLITEKRESIAEFYGLKNVLYRLKLYYGENSHLTIKSNQNVGTTVTMFIPMKASIGFSH